MPLGPSECIFLRFVENTDLLPRTKRAESQRTSALIKTITPNGPRMKPKVISTPHYATTDRRSEGGGVGLPPRSDEPFPPFIFIDRQWRGTDEIIGSGWQRRYRDVVFAFIFVVIVLLVTECGTMIARALIGDHQLYNVCRQADARSAHMARLAARQAKVIK